MGSRFKPKPCLNVHSEFLVYLWNVPVGLAGRELKSKIGSQIGVVRFIETFEAWNYRPSGHIILEFGSYASVEFFVEMMAAERIPYLQKPIGFQDLITCGRRQFFELVYRDTGVDLLGCDGHPPSNDWNRQRPRGMAVRSALGGDSGASRWKPYAREGTRGGNNSSMRRRSQSPSPTRDLGPFPRASAGDRSGSGGALRRFLWSTVTGRAHILTIDELGIRNTAGGDRKPPGARGEEIEDGEIVEEVQQQKESEIEVEEGEIVVPEAGEDDSPPPVPKRHNYSGGAGSRNNLCRRPSTDDDGSRSPPPPTVSSSTNQQRSFSRELQQRLQALFGPPPSAPSTPAAPTLPFPPMHHRPPAPPPLSSFSGRPPPPLQAFGTRPAAAAVAPPPHQNNAGTTGTIKNTYWCNNNNHIGNGNSIRRVGDCNGGGAVYQHNGVRRNSNNDGNNNYFNADNNNGGNRRRHSFGAGVGSDAVVGKKKKRHERRHRQRAAGGRQNSRWHNDGKTGAAPPTVHDDDEVITLGSDSDNNGNVSAGSGSGMSAPPADIAGCGTTTTSSSSFFPSSSAAFSSSSNNNNHSSSNSSLFSSAPRAADAAALCRGLMDVSLPQINDDDDDTDMKEINRSAAGHNMMIINNTKKQQQKIVVVVDDEEELYWDDFELVEHGFENNVIGAASGGGLAQTFNRQWRLCKAMGHRLNSGINMTKEGGLEGTKTWGGFLTFFPAEMNGESVAAGDDDALQLAEEEREIARLLDNDDDGDNAAAVDQQQGERSTTMTEAYDDLQLLDESILNDDEVEEGNRKNIIDGMESRQQQKEEEGQEMGEDNDPDEVNMSIRCMSLMSLNCDDSEENNEYRVLEITNLCHGYSLDAIREQLQQAIGDVPCAVHVTSTHARFHCECGAQRAARFLVDELDAARREQLLGPAPEFIASVGEQRRRMSELFFHTVFVGCRNCSLLNVRANFLLFILLMASS
uniref:RRM domain-containing protein n=1 Tax=Globodera rostochiensis TaxID=31243 RepID=A0A914HVK2_GLORO